MRTVIDEGYNPPPVARVKRPRPMPAPPSKSEANFSRIGTDEKKCRKCGNLLSNWHYCDFCGYEGTGVIDTSLSCYNMRCLKSANPNPPHPPFPFELWGYIGFVVRSEAELERALVKNEVEGERRQKAGI